MAKTLAIICMALCVLVIIMALLVYMENRKLGPRENRKKKNSSSLQ